MADRERARRESDGPVVTITLDRPDKRNALDSAMAALLLGWLAELDEDPALGCLVLTGADPAFCAGLDLHEFRARGHAPPGTPELIRAVADLSVPVIAAVNGPAFTGGLEIVLGCDIVIASERASFADTHARNNLMPGGGLSVRLAEAVGVRRAKRMSFTGQPVSAGEALELGLADEVVEHSRLLTRVGQIARDIAAMPPDAIRAMKKLYRAVTGEPVDTGIRIEHEMRARYQAERRVGKVVTPGESCQR